MNICVKYCGGCNPRYDRKKVINNLKRDFQNVSIIPQLDNDNATCDFALIISGCIRSCTNHKDIEGRYGKFVITDLKDYEILKLTLETILDKLV